MRELTTLLAHHVFVAGESGRRDLGRLAVWTIVVGSLAGIALSPHVFVAWIFDLLLFATLAFVLLRAQAGYRGWGAAALGGFLGAALPFGLMVGFGDRLEPFMSRHGVDALAFPLFVRMLAMPTACVLCAWTAAGFARALRKP